MLVRGSLPKSKQFSIKKDVSNFKFDHHNRIYQEGKVWRSESRHPEQVTEQGGFFPFGTNKNLRLHVERSRGVYVAYGNSVLDAKRFCRIANFDFKNFDVQIGSYLYKCNTPEVFVNVKTAIPFTMRSGEAFGPDFVAGENEIAGIGPQDSSNIHSARPYIAVPGFGIPFAYFGDLFVNNHYKNRKYAISIPSACQDEALTFQDAFYKEKTMTPDFRFILPNEARAMADALREQEKYFQINEETPLFVARLVPADCNNEKAVAHVVNEYQAFRKKHNAHKKEDVVCVEAKVEGIEKESNPQQPKSWLKSIREAAVWQNKQASSYSNMLRQTLFGQSQPSTNQQQPSSKNSENKPTQLRK